MARRIATGNFQRLSTRVPNMAYVAGIESGAIVYANYGAPTAADAALGTAGMILTGQSISSAGSTTTFLSGFTQSLAQMSPYGRCLWIVASGASTANVTIRGRDYLGQPMADQKALNGTTTAICNKAFRTVDSITWEAGGAVTMNVGLSNSFGLPFKFLAIQSELKNNAIAANNGTFVVGTNAQLTAGSFDPRGRYTISTVLPDGINTFELYYLTDRTQIHGTVPFNS